MSEKTLNVLFLCTHNSARSILAEAILNHIGRGRFKGFSAGSSPLANQQPNPLGLKVLHNAGISVEGLHSKSWDEFGTSNAPKMDLVITVCDNAAGETCPIFPGKPIKAHWGVSDPAHFEGTQAEIEVEFDRIFSMLEHRVKAFLRLPLEQIDKDELQQKLNEIGSL